MPKFTKQTAIAIAQSINDNVRAVDAGEIDWNTFSSRNLALWQSVDRNELRIIGSACDKRMAMVEAAMRQIH